RQHRGDGGERVRDRAVQVHRDARAGRAQRDRREEATRRSAEGRARPRGQGVRRRLRGKEGGGGVGVSRMPSLIDLRRRIRAVKNTQQITKAMKMVAASKLRRAQERIMSARPYATEMQRVLSSVAGRVDPSIHPLLSIRAPRPGAKTLVIIVTGDKGLCGSFNTNVIKAAGAFITESTMP